MKKIMVLLLALMLILPLSACKEDNKLTNNSDTSKPNNVFTELVVVDDENCFIKIKEIDPDNTWGYTLKVELENKSSDKTFMFIIDGASINGVQSDPLFATEVTAGKKANDDITFLSSDFENNDIGLFTDIKLTFRVYDSNNWSADDIIYKTVHVYPYGEDKAVKYVREAQPNDNIILDNEYVTAIVTGYDPEGFFGYTVNMFLINKTANDVMFSVDGASVNGYMSDPFYATAVFAGNCAFSSISWFEDTLKENGITNVETIEFELIAYNLNNFADDNYAEMIVTLHP